MLRKLDLRGSPVHELLNVQIRSQGSSPHKLVALLPYLLGIQIEKAPPQLEQAPLLHVTSTCRNVTDIKRVQTRAQSGSSCSRRIWALQNGSNEHWMGC